jgi:hypothetical protein
MDLIYFSDTDDTQFKFIISDTERRSIWFPCIIDAMEGLKVDIGKAKSHVNVERFTNVKFIRELTYHLIKKKGGNLLKEIDIYLHWFKCKNTKDYDGIYIDEDTHYTALFTKLDEIEAKGVKEYVKEFYNMFELSLGHMLWFNLKEEIRTILFEQAGAISLGIDDMKLKIETTLSPREFFARLPHDFPHWFIDGTFETGAYKNFKED